MVLRMKYLNPEVKVSMVFGSNSWIDNSIAAQIFAELRPDQFETNVIRDAGHHIYADQPEEFNELMVGKFERVDEEEQK